MITKANFFSDNPEILFHLVQRMDFESLYAWLSPEEREATGASTPEEYRQNWLDFFETYGEVCGTNIASNAQEVEKHDLTLDAQGNVQLPEALKENLAMLKELGVPALGINPQFGGIGNNFLIVVAAFEMLSRACPSTHLNACWWGSIAHVIEMFGDESLKKSIIPRLASGEWSGSMALTEPDAGSDLAALRTYGERQGDGRWKLFGSKRFISNGDGEVSLVLAKGAKGKSKLSDLSLFVCLRHKEDGTPNFHVTRLEEKLALHGSATCELKFDGAEAYLLGREGDGFRQMLKLMNDARIGVAFQGLGNMEASLRLAQNYASDRVTWGKPIAKHELIAEKLLDMEVELKAFRSLCYQAAYNQTMYYSGEGHLQNNTLTEAERTDAERRIGRHRKRVRRWTPLVKWWAGERAIHFARNAVQILGGYGFTKEYRAEWLLRESMIISIYEGTSQIQALMCLKDTMKDAVGNPKDFVETAMGLKLKGIAESNHLRKKLYRAKEICQSSIGTVIIRLVRHNMKESLSEVRSKDLREAIKLLGPELLRFDNLAPALIHAERICEMKSIVAIAEAAVWDAETDPSREWIADRFLRKFTPRLQMLKLEIDDYQLHAPFMGEANQTPDEKKAPGGTSKTAALFRRL